MESERSECEVSGRIRRVSRREGVRGVWVG